LVLLTNSFYISIHVSVSCGGVYEYQGTNITISSPNYPAIYPPDVFCVFTVSVSSGRPCVEIVDLHADKLFGYVSVYDGTSLTDFPLNRYVCGCFCDCFFPILELLMRIKIFAFHIYFTKRICIEVRKHYEFLHLFKSIQDNETCFGNLTLSLNVG